MFRSHTRPLAWAIAVAGPLLAAFGVARAANAPYAGKWKVTIHPPGQSQTLWIIQLEDKNGKPDGKVSATSEPNLKNAKIEHLAADDDAVRFTVHVTGPQNNVIEFAFAAYYPKPGAKNKNLVGSVVYGPQRVFAELEATDLATLDARTASFASPGLDEVQTAMKRKDQKERDAALKQFLDTYPDGTLAYFIRLAQAAEGTQQNLPEADLRPGADKFVEQAANHGTEMKLDALEKLTQIFLHSDKLHGLALTYAQQAEKTLGKSTPATDQEKVLKLLVTTLKKNGKLDEAKALKGRIAKLDAELDLEFARTSVPFKPEPAKPRTASNGRIALIELFTGVMCPPCVAADVAFDALLLSHKANDVVVLQYHEHIPGPDPLTNKDSESRFEFYSLRSAPSIVIDGKEGPTLGGPRQAGKESYNSIVKALDTTLENKPAAELKASAVRSGDKINIHADVSGLQTPGESVRLRLVLVEEQVHFAGANGQRLHHHVVRAFPGGVEGLALKQAAGKQDVSVNIADLRKSLNDYLAGKKFDDESRPLDLKHLKVVAFVQDDATKEVLQAAQVDINESKSETN